MKIAIKHSEPQAKNLFGRRSKIGKTDAELGIGARPRAG